MALIRPLLLSFMLALSLPALALDLQTAKNQGLVGEQPDGYLGTVSSSAPADVRQLVSEINTKRRAAYQDSASDAGVSLEVMEQRVGQRLIQKASHGHFFKLPNGDWQKK